MPLPGEACGAHGGPGGTIEDHRAPGEQRANSAVEADGHAADGSAPVHANKYPDRYCKVAARDPL